MVKREGGRGTDREKAASLESGNAGILPSFLPDGRLEKWDRREMYRVTAEDGTSGNRMYIKYCVREIIEKTLGSHIFNRTRNIFFPGSLVRQHKVPECKLFEWT